MDSRVYELLVTLRRLRLPPNERVVVMMPVVPMCTPHVWVVNPPELFLSTTHSCRIDAPGAGVSIPSMSVRCIRLSISSFAIRLFTRGGVLALG